MITWLRFLGKYFIFISSMFVKREKFSVYPKLIIDECAIIGLDSIVIVSIVSTFIGAVSSIQTAANLVSDFIPLSVVGTVVRDMEILELAPTITCVVLAGKVGSSIAGNLGTMRITEQIDALEVMGINSASYLVLPKIIAALIMFPLLISMSGFLGIWGGYVSATLTGAVPGEEYIAGIRTGFQASNVVLALLKSFVFAFLISSISAFQGFFTKGGALEVGKSSTNAVTNSCIATLVADYLLAQLFLS
ncbi:MAG: ABC transporter permease [Bacteroidetes bacterium]|nr:MAG: ABC transporter permease [Bacteroidota bacterium]